MKQIEITLRLNETMESAIKKLENLGFINIRESDINDIYMTQLKKEMTKDNIQYILSKSLLLRSLKIDESEIKKITYKNKEYENGQVISEEKVNVNCDDLKNAKKLFEHLDFEELIEVKYHVLVMAKDGVELAFQKVEGLGILIEYENINDYSNKTLNEIKEEKIKMYEMIKSLGVEITKEIDVKKAEELIKRKYF